MSGENSNGIIKYDVPLYSQGWTNLCWAHCQVMLECFEKKIRLTQSQARARARELSMEKYGKITGGGPTNIGQGIKVENIQALHDILVSEKGPFYVNYLSRKSAGGHLVVITGVDVNADIVYTNNSDGFFGLALRGKQTFKEFLNGVVTGPIYGWFSNLYFDQVLLIAR